MRPRGWDMAELASTAPDLKEQARAARILDAEFDRHPRHGIGSRSARRDAEIRQARRERRRSMVSRP